MNRIVILEVMDFRKTTSGKNYLEKGSGPVILWIPGLGQIGKEAIQIYKDSPLFKHFDTTEPPCRLIALQLTKNNQSEMADYILSFVSEMNIKPLLVAWSFGGASAMRAVKKNPSAFIGIVEFAMAPLSPDGFNEVTIPGYFIHDTADDVTNSSTSSALHNIWGGTKGAWIKQYWGHYSTWVKFTKPGGLEGLDIYKLASQLSNTTPPPIETKTWKFKSVSGYVDLGLTDPTQFKYE